MTGTRLGAGFARPSGLCKLAGSALHSPPSSARFSVAAMSQDTPPHDPFEFLKRMWAPMGLPMPGAMAPLLDPNEIEKRIADLKSVENWLAMNLNVLRMTIQGLEMQRATLAAFQGLHAPAAAGAQASTPEATSRPGTAAGAADAWWNLLQQTQAAAAPAPQSEPKREKKPK